MQIAQLMEADINSLPEYRQEIPQTPQFVILHCSTPKIVWDWLILIFILYTATSIPFMVCFKFNSDPMTIADTVVDVMFLVDIFLNFHTSYVDEDGTIVFDTQRIRRTYFRSWFLVDFITSLPYGLMGLLMARGAVTGITDLISFLKAFRLLRLNRVVRALDQYLEYGFITLILWMLFFCLCAHWMACIFYLIADHYDKFADIGWVRAMSEATQQQLLIINGTIIESPSLASLYMSSLYFSLTSLTSIGFGNIAPNTTAEKIFSCVTMIFGGLCYAVIFGQVTAIVQQSQKKSEGYHETLNNMRSFCKLYKVPKEISTRIVDYYMYTWVLNRGVDTNSVLQNCPKDLQSDICIHLNRKVIDSTPAFGELSNAVLRAIARNFAIHRVAPGERVVHEGESLDTLFFVASGSFEITQKGQVVGLIGEGDVFGDDICRNNDTGRSAADVFALTYSNVHVIGRNELLGALSFYPECGYQFVKVFRLSYNLRDEITMRKFSSHPNRKSHGIPKELEVGDMRKERQFSFVEEMQNNFETDSTNFDLGTPNSQNMTDTDPPSKPFVSQPNAMKTISEAGGELEESVADEDFKRWDEYQNERKNSAEVINEISDMKSEVRREIEAMGGKMNHLEENISTILSLLQERDSLNAGSRNLGPALSRTGGSIRGRTSSIVSQVKAGIPEETLPDWVDMENFGMAKSEEADSPKDDVDATEKKEDEPAKPAKKNGKKKKNKRKAEGGNKSDEVSGKSSRNTKHDAQEEEKPQAHDERKDDAHEERKDDARDERKDDAQEEREPKAHEERKRDKQKEENDETAAAEVTTEKSTLESQHDNRENDGPAQPTETSSKLSRQSHRKPEEADGRIASAREETAGRLSRKSLREPAKESEHVAVTIEEPDPDEDNHNENQRKPEEEAAPLHSGEANVKLSRQSARDLHMIDERDGTKSEEIEMK